MRRFSLAIAWLLSFAGAQVSAEPIAGRLGDLVYDSARWQVERVDNGYRVTPVGGDRSDVSVFVTILPGEVAACSDDALSKGAGLSQDPEILVLRKPGFDIRVVSGWTGCRNARPPSVLACTTYKGRVYRFDALVDGCRGGPGFGDGALAFLDGLSAR